MLSLMKSKRIRGGFGLVAVVASAWLGAGCTTTETVQGPSPLDTEDGFCQALATAQCSASLVSSCYNTKAMDPAFKNDTTRCVAAASRADICNPTGLPYHSEAAQDALDKVTSIYADGVLTDNELPALSAALATVFNRGEAKGSKCVVDTDCDAGNGLTCILHGGNGTCGEAMIVAAGSSCATVNASCGENNYCAKFDSGYDCIAKIAAGKGKCAGDFECTDGTRCGSDSLCHALRQDGADCTFGADCAHSFCLKKNADDKTGFCAAEDKFDPFSSSCDIYR
jgi:hypothetical protein